MPDSSKPRLLALPRYERLGASSRLRCFDLAPFWEEEGFEVSFAPLFPNSYIERRYRGEPQPKVALIRAYQRRRTLLAETDADLLWLQVEAFPFLPFACESGLLARQPYVLDLDDAWFHRYDQHSSALVRRFLGSKIDRLMAEAALVVCANEYLCTRAGRAGAPRVELAPTGLDAAAYAALPPAAGDPPVIGWIGAPQNLSYLEPLAPLLAELTRSGKAELLLVTAKTELPGFLADIPHHLLAWREEEEMEAIARMDIGIMPLPDSPWERGKSGFKLIQYMAAGRAAIASPVGVNTALAEDGRCALLASDPGQWAAALQLLLEDQGLRRALGERAREKAIQGFDREKIAHRQAGWFKEVL